MKIKDITTNIISLKSDNIIQCTFPKDTLHLNREKAIITKIN